MASFTTRVELHSAQPSDYDELHKFMQQQGFSRTIKSDDGKEYHLPTAEYNLKGDLEASDVLAKAKWAAERTGRAYSAIVTETVRRTWHGLKEVTRQPARRY